MPKPRKTPRKPRAKVVKIQFMPRPDKKAPKDPACPYAIMDRLMADHHPDLAGAKIAIAWMLDVKPDRDGKLILGRLRKTSDMDKEFRDFDFVMMLNASAWKMLNLEVQKPALVDHELCHGTEATDKNGEPMHDERGRKCWRLRKHDLEEFVQIPRRYGLYLSDVAEFVYQAIESPLFKSRQEARQAM